MCVAVLKYLKEEVIKMAQSQQLLVFLKVCNLLSDSLTYHSAYHMTSSQLDHSKCVTFQCIKSHKAHLTMC